MTSAEPLDCHVCRRRIGKRRTHFMTEAGPFPVCGRCLDARHTHAQLYPDCPAAWHTMHDHGLVFATRAAAHHIIARGGITMSPT